MDSTTIGLDIGSSAVRAAEITLGRDGNVLRNFAQVGLPSGAVVDGEIVNPVAVSTALRRLWTEGGFSGNKVVLGVSGHRVIVRQADVPALNEEDLRSALRFDAQELIPIPMDHACFDFAILDRSAQADDGKSTMRILIVAAHKDLLYGHLTALKGAGLAAVAIDATPLSLMRVVPPSSPGPNGGDSVDALVAIGAEMTTVAVRQNGVPRFIRSLAIGGSKLTSGIANALHVDPAVAERLKRDGASDGNAMVAQAQKALSADLRDLAEEVRATVDFFAAQADGAVIERLLITGGGSQMRGLAESLAGTSLATIERIDPFVSVRTDQAGLNESELQRARAVGSTAVGLALWPLQPEESRLSILPDDIAQARRNRRLTMMAGAGVAGIAAILGVAAVGQIIAVDQARSQVTSANRQAVALEAKVTQLQAKTAVHDQATTRAGLVVTALKGDIDWVSVLNQLKAVIPPGITVSTFTGARVTATGTSPTTSTPGIGSVTFAVTGPGGLPTVASWLEGLQRDNSLQGTWVQGIALTSNGGTVTFNSTSNLTKQALSNRVKAVSK